MASIACGLMLCSAAGASAVADRIQNHVLPFFSEHLCFSNACQ
jgi:hypothetical protein